MQNIQIHRRTIGINFKGLYAEIVLWSPDANDIQILINHNITLPLQKNAFGYWQLTTDELHPGDHYLFIKDGQQYPDPASVSQPNGVHGVSQALDISAYDWTDDSWNNIPLDQYIFYELHTGTFTKETTFAAIEGKLDHLIELGITAIELMPVAQFPGSRNWGYDGVFPFAVQFSYGGADALKHLVNACHKKNLAVVLDVVYNHLGPEGNYLETFAPYFTDKYKTPWGKAVNFDDACCDGVRHFIVENVLMWFRDFHIDALRFDAIHAVRDFSPQHIMQEIKHYTDAWMNASGNTHYLIIECDLNDTRFINSVENCGFGIDAQWCDEFHHALRVTCGQEKEGYYEDFSGIAHLAKAYKNAYVHDGQYSAHRKKKFGMTTEKNQGQQFVVFSQNHDQVGNRMLGERTSTLVVAEMLKLMAGAVILSPYLPLLFMGEEWGDTNPFLYFTDHSDPGLSEAVFKGRQEEFKSFKYKGEVPDPGAVETFMHSSLQWDLLQKEPHHTLFGYYKALISLRKKIAPLRILNREQMKVEYDEPESTLILHRWDEDQNVICLMNFSGKEQEIEMSSSKPQWKTLLNSADPEWGGGHTVAPLIAQGEKVTIQPASLLVYTNCYV